MSRSIHPEALAELRDAADWYEDQREGLGDEFLDAVMAALDRGFPLAELESEDLEGGALLRRYLLKRFPYKVVLYESPDGELQVVAVSHQKRRPLYWAKRLPEGHRRRRRRR